MVCDISLVQFLNFIYMRKTNMNGKWESKPVNIITPSPPNWIIPISSWKRRVLSYVGNIHLPQIEDRSCTNVMIKLFKAENNFWYTHHSFPKLNPQNYEHEMTCERAKQWILYLVPWYMEECACCTTKGPNHVEECVPKS